jgi:hypothetical protein
VSPRVKPLSKISAPKLYYFCSISAVGARPACVLSSGSSFWWWFLSHTQEVFDEMCVSL